MPSPALADLVAEETDHVLKRNKATPSEPSAPVPPVGNAAAARLAAFAAQERGAAHPPAPAAPARAASAPAPQAASRAPASHNSGNSLQKAVDLFTASDLREPTYVPATSIKDNYAGYAACAWEAEWLAGRRTSDTGRVRAATRVLGEARSWPDAGADKTGGARRQRDQIATAAANGDPAPLRDDVKANCPPSWTRSSDR